jgi:hypothetical protein
MPAHSSFQALAKRSTEPAAEATQADSESSEASECLARQEVAELEEPEE